MNKSRVPKDLQQLIPYVEKWSAETELGRTRLREEARRNPQKMAALKRFASAFTKRHKESFDTWCDQEPITKSEESSRFYFALLLLDECDLLDSDDVCESVQFLIHALEKTGGVRLASERMFAARRLAELGEKAALAIPALEGAGNDLDSRVRIWSHYALWRLNGRDSMHIEVIRHALAETNRQAQMEAASALRLIGSDACEAVPELIEQIRLQPQMDSLTPLFITTLGCVGKGDPRARQVLEDASKDHDDRVRQAAIQAMSTDQTDK